jgi:transcriptional regulator of NAD metabolism
MAQRIIKVPVTSLEDREERQKISDELNRRRIRVVCMTTHGNDVYMVLEGDDTETLAI